MTKSPPPSVSTPEAPRHPRLVAAAAVFGLGAFALSLPVVRVLVDAPEFLIAHRLRPGAASLFFAAVIIGAPALLAALSALPGSLGRGLRGVIVTGLSLAAVAGIAQPISRWSAPFWFAVVVGGIGLAAAERRRPAVRSTCAVATVLALLLGAWVVGPSRVGRYLRSGDAAALTTPVATDTPVVVVVLDEFSLVPVLDRDLEVDAERFPHLAALADTSHWFRLAASVSPQTSASVPALLSGVEADLDLVPVSAQYPTNIFRRLAASHDLASYEPITELCGDLCSEAAAPEAPAAADGPDLGGVIDDTAVILRHALSTDDIRSGLPSLARSWAGFDPEVDPDAASGLAERGYGTFFAQAEALRALVEAEPDSVRPPLRVAHLVTPHLPWVALPDGSVDSGSEPEGLAAVNAMLTWASNEAHRRAGYQRYLFQVGALDREIGALRATLEQTGLWDEALVVVTADHGLQFEPGPLRDVAAGGVEVTGVPLFIKEPGQTEGITDDRPALTIDVVPTILGALGAGHVEGHDGLDLFHDEIPDQRSGAFLASPGASVTPDQRVETLQAAVARRAAWIDPDGGWDAVYQAGVDRELVRRPLAALAAGATPAGTWSRAAGEAGLRVSWTIRGSSARAVLVVCDGVVAGAVPVASSAEPLSGVVYASHELCATPIDAQLAVLDPAGEVRPLEHRS